MQVTSKSLQKVNGSSQTTQTIFVAETPQHPEEADRLISLRRRLRYSFGNCLEETLEPFRLYAPQNAAPKKKIPNGANGFGRFRIVHDFIQDVVTCRHRAPHKIECTAIVQFLEYFVGRQDRFCVLFGSLSQPRAQFRT
jgi:hypothetical protein